MKTTWILAVLLCTAACSNREASQQADSTLSRDLSLASQVAPKPQPAFNDTAVSQTPAPTPHAQERTKAPTRQPPNPAPQPAVTTLPNPVAAAPDSVATPIPQPAAPAAAPAPVVVAAPAREIAMGTSMTLSLTSRACMSTSKPGDRLVGTVNTAVVGTGGATIPAGSSVVLEVASVDQATATDSAEIALRVKSVIVNDSSYPVSGDVTALGPLQKVAAPAKSNDARNKVIGGAVVGAILGQIIGHDTKGTVVGAAAGAATGAAVAKATKNYDACLPQGASLQLTLRRAISM